MIQNSLTVVSKMQVLQKDYRVIANTHVLATTVPFINST
jgi:hypothetical protein